MVEWANPVILLALNSINTATTFVDLPRPLSLLEILILQQHHHHHIFINSILHLQ